MTNLDPAGFAIYFDLMFSVVLQSVKSQKMSLFPLLMLLTSKEKHLYKKVIITNTNNYSFELVKIASRILTRPGTKFVGASFVSFIPTP